jgi:hypothetical protein
MTDLKSILALAERLRSIADSAPPFAREHGESVGIVVNLPGAIEREAAAVIIHLCERLERAEAALKPFAQQGMAHQSDATRVEIIACDADGESWFMDDVRLGDLCAARVALQEKP